MKSRLLAAPLALIAGVGIVAGTFMETDQPTTAVEWVFIAISLPLPALGWLLAARRPDLRYGWLLLAAGLSFGLGTLGFGLFAQGGAGVLAALLTSVYALFYGLTWIFVPLLFPEGRLPSRRWRAVAWISGVAIAMHGGGLLLSSAWWMRPDQPLDTLALVSALVSVEGLLARRDVRGQQEALTARERDVLREMAHGRTNSAIARALHLSISSVEKNVNAIFTKLGLENSGDVHRRVAAVLAYLGPDPS